MGYYTTAEIVKIVNKLIDRCGTRDPYKVAKELGINVIYRNFDKQRGAYKVILKNRFVFLKNGMHPVVEQIVLWHEIGHDVLHRQEAVAVGGFKEFNIFDMRENRMEYEANIFASQASLPDDTILEYIKNGYDIQQIARAMCSDINLIALKVDTLIAQGYQLRKQEHQNDFLKYSKKYKTVKPRLSLTVFSLFITFFFIIFAPTPHSVENRFQALSQFCQGVFYSRRYFGIYLSVYESVFFHITKLSSQNLLGNAAD